MLYEQQHMTIECIAGLTAKSSGGGRKITAKTKSARANTKSLRSTLLGSGFRLVGSRDISLGAQGTTLLAGLVAAIFFGLSDQNATAAPSVVPTGVTYYDPTRAYGSYVVFDGPDMKTHLIDMDGNQVHSWDHVGFPSEMLSPSRSIGGKRGDVLLQLSAIDGEATGVVPGQPATLRNRTIGELDWDGNIMWKWGEKAPTGAARQHHDQYRMENGDTLVLSNEFHHVDGFSLNKVLDDTIYEVAPSGEIVWRWSATNHLNEFGLSPAELAFVYQSKAPDFLHTNDMQPLGPNKWFANGDQRFAPENILISSRNANFLAIIEKKTGKVVWKIGPHYQAKAETAQQDEHEAFTNTQMSGQHDAHMIAEGLPGAGNILVFDNQGEAGYPPVALGVLPGSRVLEIDPVTEKVVWYYSALSSDRPTWTFYSAFIGSARRLPNGNTLINEGMNGRIFQVTPDGAIVWEYVNPYFANETMGGINKKVWTNEVYRAQPVPYEWVPKDTPRAENPVETPDGQLSHAR